MSLLHLPQSRLLLLLAIAAGVLGDTTVAPVEADGSLETIRETTRETTSKTLEISAAPSTDRAAKHELRLFCLANGSMLLYCDPTTQDVKAIHWTLDGKELKETQPDIEPNKTVISLAKGVSGSLGCWVEGSTVDYSSSSINLECEGDKWFFYGLILIAIGGGELLLSIVLLAIACCCCKRRTGHHSGHLVSGDIELVATCKDPEKKHKVDEVSAVEETTLISNKTTPNTEPEADGFQFPDPPEMAAESDGKDPPQDGVESIGAGSDCSFSDETEDKTVEKGSNEVQEN